MRILAISNLYPSSREPTRGVFNRSRFDALAAHCEVRVVVPIRWWSRLSTPRELVKVRMDDGSGLVAYYPTYWPVPHHPLSHVPAMARSLRHLLSAIRTEYSFDAILVAMAFPEGVAAARVAGEIGCPVVTVVLGSDVNALAARAALRPHIAEALRQSHCVVAVSEALQKRVVELGVSSDAVVVQRNGVDGGRFRPRDRAEARTRLGLQRNEQLITYVGNLAEEKGVDVLLEAMAPSLGVPRGAKLHLVGGGPLATKLAHRAEQLGITDSVRFFGRRPHTEIPDWIAATDVFCLASRREGCPNVVLEALASGRPVVASAVGGIPELLTQQNGVLVPPDDPAALASGLATALEQSWDPEALRATVPCLSWDQFGATLHSALEHAVRCYRRNGNSPGVTRAAASAATP